MYDIETEISESILKDGALLVWRKKGLGSALFAVGGLSLSVWLYFKDGLSNAVVSFAILIFILGGLSAFVYFSYLNRSRKILHQMQRPIVRWFFDNEKIRAESDLGTTELKWHAVKEIICSPSVWLLVFEGGTSSTLPAKNLTSEMKDFLKERVTATGGKVL